MIVKRKQTVKKAKFILQAQNKTKTIELLSKPRRHVIVRFPSAQQHGGTVPSSHFLVSDLLVQLLFQRFLTLSNYFLGVEIHHFDFISKVDGFGRSRLKRLVLVILVTVLWCSHARRRFLYLPFFVAGCYIFSLVFVPGTGIFRRHQALVFSSLNIYINTDPITKSTTRQYYLDSHYFLF